MYVYVCVYEREREKKSDLHFETYHSAFIFQISFSIHLEQMICREETGEVCY